MLLAQGNDSSTVATPFRIPNASAPYIGSTWSQTDCDSLRSRCYRALVEIAPRRGKVKARIHKRPYCAQICTSTMYEHIGHPSDCGYDLVIPCLCVCIVCLSPPRTVPQMSKINDIPKPSKISFCCWLSMCGQEFQGTLSSVPASDLLKERHSCTTCRNMQNDQSWRKAPISDTSPL